jgi:beta-N-acetylglucosaminidase-like protein
MPHRNLGSRRLLLVAALAGWAACTPDAAVSPVAVACQTPSYPRVEWSTPMPWAGGSPAVCVSPALAAATPVLDELATLGFAVVTKGHCALDLELSFDAPPAAAEMPMEWQQHVDGYAWIGQLNGSLWTFTLYAKSPRAVDYGFHALLSLIAAQPPELPRAAADWPRFPRRGVIEGYYNQPLSAGERSTTLVLMHQLRQNSYLYAPKDDPYAGYDWRDAYSKDAATDVAAAAAQAAKLGIDFIFGISPTLAANGANSQFGRETSIRFSSADDFAALVAKLRSVKALGVSHFAVLFDDVDSQLFHAEDRAAFSTLAQAHSSLANRLAPEFGGDLLFVGDFYNSSATGWQGYIQELGQTLLPSIDVMWTGPSTFSRTIANADIIAVNNVLGRQVAIWDNWPVEAIPVGGRDPQLFNVTTTMMTNATLIGDYGHPAKDFWKVLGPIAAYAWDPIGYSPDDAYSTWQGTLEQLLSCKPRP